MNVTKRLCCDVRENCWQVLCVAMKCWRERDRQVDSKIRLKVAIKEMEIESVKNQINPELEIVVLRDRQAGR